jgi:hypothetical protein
LQWYFERASGADCTFSIVEQDVNKDGLADGIVVGDERRGKSYAFCVNLKKTPLEITPVRPEWYQASDNIYRDFFDGKLRKWVAAGKPPIDKVMWLKEIPSDQYKNKP